VAARKRLGLADSTRGPEELEYTAGQEGLTPAQVRGLLHAWGGWLGACVHVCVCVLFMCTHVHVGVCHTHTH